MKKYSVRVDNKDNSIAVASAHDFSYKMSSEQGSVKNGINAAETLLSSLGICLLTNLNSLSQKMHLNLKETYLEITGIRQADPPKIVEIEVCFCFTSNEDDKKIQKLINLCVKYGTVTNTLMESVKIKYKYNLRRINEKDSLLPNNGTIC